MTTRPLGARFLASTLIALLLVPASVANARGPGIDYHEQLAATMDEAGSTHVAVLSVALWDEYADAMAPDFSLTAKEALQEVLPTTSLLDEIVQRAFAASLGLAPPTSANTRSHTVKEATGSDLQASTESKQEAGPGDASKLQPPALPLDKFTQVPLLPVPQKLDVEPIMQYRAANALLQEVAVLNRYARDAARRNGYEPYILRLQVSLMPRARNEPYDAYVDMGFFVGDGQGAIQPDGSRGASPQLAGATPQVVPLLVTDSYEGALTQRSDDQVRQMGLALGFLLGGFSGNGGASSFKKTFERIVANDWNSLHSVARLSDNSVRVRFGAMIQPQSRFAMIPSTHDITLLLLVPKEAFEDTFGRRMRVSSNTTFVHARTGKELPPRSHNVTDSALTTVATKYHLEQHRACFRKLGQCVIAGDRSAFVHELTQLADGSTEADCQCTALDPMRRRFRRDQPGTRVARLAWPPPSPRRILDLANAIWLDLAHLYVGASGGTTVFDLPRPSVPTLPHGEACANLDGAWCEKTARCPGLVMFDDQKSKAVVKLSGGSHLGESSLTARLLVPTTGGITALVPSSGLKVSSDHRDVSLEFPTLAGLSRDMSKLPVLVVEYADPNAGRWDPGAGGAVVNPTTIRACIVITGPTSDAAKPAPLVTVTPNPASLREVDGEASLELAFAKPDDKAVTPDVSFVVKGGVASVKGQMPASTIEVKDGKTFVRSFPSVVTLALSGLKAGKSVTIEVTVKKEPKPEIITLPLDVLD